MSTNNKTKFKKRTSDVEIKIALETADTCKTDINQIDKTQSEQLNGDVEIKILLEKKADTCQHNMNQMDNTLINGENFSIKNSNECLFPEYSKKSLFIFTQKSKFRYACIKLIQSPYPF